jgi:MoxR-like ATPase
MIEQQSDKASVDALKQKYELLQIEIGKAIYGQQDVVNSVITSILCNGHCLLVGVPGLAKTLLVQTVSKVLDLSFSRVQFTPDLMPSDITGSEILDESKHFKFVPGPLFANLVLADEINRTPPKTQAALLEAMQERKVTVAGKSYDLPAPFFVLATQNPIEQEGTYPLPEAQLDRFMMNISLDYPAFMDEVRVVRDTTSNIKSELKPILSAEEILHYQNLVRRVPVNDYVLEYAVKLVHKTRPQGEFATDQVKKYVSWGAGPRASQYLVLGAKCHAILNGKYAPDVEDVQAVAKNILRHRVVLNYKAESEGINIDQVIENLF